MTARSDLLAAQLRTAMTKTERRDAVQSFMSSQASPEDVRAMTRADQDLRAFIRGARNTNLYESRAAGEATAGAGAELVPPGFATSVIRYLKEYDGVLSDVEDLETPHGEAWKRPQVSAFTAAGAAVTENNQVPDGSASLVAFAGQQAFGQTPSYAALLITSFQVLQDANVPLTAMLASAAAESIGREVASVASTALYAAATTGQEVSISSVSAASVAKLLANIDPAFLPGAKLYVSPADYATMASADITGLRHLSKIVPVVVTHAATNYVTTTVSGPVLANLGRFLTMRRVNSIGVQVLQERYADLLQVGVIAHLRADFQPTGQATAAVFSK